ncbi:hypothetical protein G6F56_003176 [Rhizopus delemar]|nr:hypothetical protein G6F56_003176 [Rhizopus delemar]
MRPVPLFNVIQQEHYCCLDDIDYNQHMNNGMYNKILDFNRIELIYSVLPKAILEPDHHIFAHNAGVVTLFKKEIPPFAKYRTEGRFYSWDDKWIILQHRFVLEDDTVACYAFSKIVFKKLSGKTVAPETVFKLCGHDLTDKEIEERRARNWETAQHFLSLDKAKEDPYPWKSKL